MYIDCDVAVYKGGRNHNWITGTGIAFDGQDIIMLDNGEAARIPWSAVRRWRWNIEGYSRTTLSRNANNTEKTFNAVENQRARALAAQKSGFFLEVADIEKPEWQFTTTNQAILKKWQEILRQISEGTLAASSPATTALDARAMCAS